MIAGAILAGVAAAGAYIFGWWPSGVRQGIAWAWAFLRSTSPVPHWLLALLVLLAAPAVLLALFLLWELVVPKNKAPDRPDWYLYTTDCFFGLRWRWSYGAGGHVQNLVHFCPHCDFQVYPYKASPFAALDGTTFRCDSCGRNLGTVEETPSLLEDKVIRFIHQKLRTRTWVVENQVGGQG